MRRPDLLWNWKRVARKAWSSRLMAIAVLLSGCESVLPLFMDTIPWPRWAMALLIMVVVAAAAVARLYAQPKSLP